MENKEKIKIEIEKEILISGLNLILQDLRTRYKYYSKESNLLKQQREETTKEIIKIGFLILKYGFKLNEELIPSKSIIEDIKWKYKKYQNGKQNNKIN